MKTGQKVIVSDYQDQVDALKFDVMRNIMYQSAREGWYGRLHKTVMFFATVFGTGAAVTILASLPQYTSVTLGLLVAALTTLDLVVDLSGQARKHNGLRQRFYSVLAELEDCIEDTTDLSTIRKQMYALYADEPVILRALDAICWNQTYLSLKQDPQFENLIHVSWFESLMRHVLPFDNSKFQYQYEKAAKPEAAASNTQT